MISMRPIVFIVLPDLIVIVQAIYCSLWGLLQTSRTASGTWGLRVKEVLEFSGVNNSSSQSIERRRAGAGNRASAAWLAADQTSPR